MNERGVPGPWATEGKSLGRESQAGESQAMRLALVSGVSGSGKSIALNVLEDAGYTCIDNLPVQLLPETVRILRESGTRLLALAIDSRSGLSLEPLPGLLDQLKADVQHLQVIFLDARNDVLIRRFSETRRRHPLTSGGRTLEESLRLERELLAPVAEIGHRIDTSGVSPNTLRKWIRELVATPTGALRMLFESFGYKAGIPLDADFVFDVRCLPNPHYDPRLRPLTGHDAPVVEFLKCEAQVERMFTDIRSFIENWLPACIRDNRSYVTVALGCTGGRHRSVYLVERLAAHFSGHVPTLVRHRELSKQ